MVKCGECRFWEHGSGDVGLCRRHAPPATAASDPHDKRHGIWPQTKKNDWCGEALKRME